MKRILISVLALVLVAALSVGATLAFLQDTDSDVNVMTVGSVYIRQEEFERNGTELQEFTQNLPIDPAVISDATFAWNAPDADFKVGDTDVKLWDTAKVQNTRDKIVTVKNTGLSKAYVRTWFAFEMGSIEIAKWNDYFHANVNTTDWTWDFSSTAITVIGDTNFYVVSAIYNTALEAGKSTAPSLLQYAFDEQTTNEIVESFSGAYDILVLSQAVQTTGFANATEALNKAFTADHPFKAMENSTTQVYSGEIAPLTLSGDKTVILNGVTITATNNGENAVTLDGFTGSIVILGNTTLKGAKNGDGISVSADSVLDLSGAGSLTAIGNGGAEYCKGYTNYSTTDDASYGSTGGSGIGGDGKIHIHDLASLTAEGYGVAGFGIGGNTPEISVTNTVITLARGGYINKIEDQNDPDYNKTEPEGGAAIGSMKDGAVITLENVTIEEALGGSKAAGIGARYWTAVKIDISNCTIKKVVGGASSAGIGGSRVRSNNAATQTVEINIKDSTITAQGGYYGAGIGAGYDTHCSAFGTAPIHTINISGNSVITAVGGFRGAGIGTGYHTGGLAGMITDSVVVNATASDNTKGAYTSAQDVGFGVLDLTRDGKDNTCTFNYKGTIISVPSN